MFVTKTDKKVFGCGYNSKGQLGFKSDPSSKSVGKPVEVKIGSSVDKLKVEVVKVHSGSLYSMAVCRT
jgi:alpha-tubulin suppressor-like RCC1 family protein